MYKVCSLFAGVGGIDLGFLQTNNCEIVYANEFDKYAVETYEKNFDTYFFNKLVEFQYSIWKGK